MQYYIDQLKNNWKSGLSVALVSVPLSLSLSIASGAGPIPGIITAIWAGLIASIVGGSNHNIVGPAGALSGILVGYSLAYGTPAVLPILAIIAGIFAFLAWVFRLDKYLVFIPSAVVHGFTLGVAITIAAGQLNFALGLQGLPKHEKLLHNIWESLKHISSVSPSTIIVFLSGLGFMFLMLKLRPKLPNTVIVTILGIILGGLMANSIIPIDILTLKDVYGNLSLSLISFPSFDRAFLNLDVVKGGVIVAFVAVLETLISAKIAGGMTKTKFNERREVLGVALANIGAGLAGGIPASGVFARTAINVKSGAKTNYSQMINAIAVAAISFIFIPWFSYLPLAVVASILVYAAIRMVAREHFAKLFRFDRASFWLSLFVAVLVIAYDATIGIVVGAMVSLIFFAHKLSRAQSRVIDHSVIKSDATEIKGDAIAYHFAGELTYINAKGHIETCAHLRKDAKAVILNFENLFYLDTDGMEALTEIVHEFELNRQHVFVTGIHPVLMPALKTMSWFEKLEKENKVLGNPQEALKQTITLESLKHQQAGL